MRAQYTKGGLAYLVKTFQASTSTSSSAPSPSSSSSVWVYFAHANGFVKEIFQPIIEEIGKSWQTYHHTQTHKNQHTRSLNLVSFDFSGHGDSRGVTESNYDWRRAAARDVQEIVREVPGPGGTLSSSSSTRRIGCGHSLGGSAMVMTELDHPGFFSGGLVLVEPVLLPIDRDPTMTHPLSERALKRRASWPSKLAAREYLASRPVFKRWDPRAFEAYIDGALEEVEITNSATGTKETIVELKCKPEVESGYYKGGGTSVWPSLPKLGSRVPVVFVAGGESEHMSIIIKEKGSAAAVARELVGKMGPKARLEVIEQGSHFLCMEEVKLLADLVWEEILASIQEMEGGGADGSGNGEGGKGMSSSRL